MSHVIANHHNHVVLNIAAIASCIQDIMSLHMIGSCVDGIVFIFVIIFSMSGNVYGKHHEIVVHRQSVIMSYFEP